MDNTTAPLNGQTGIAFRPVIGPERKPYVQLYLNMGTAQFQFVIPADEKTISAFCDNLRATGVAARRESLGLVVANGN